MSKIKYFDHDGCWEWIGTKNNAGYGSFRMNSSKPTEGAHRISYKIANGTIGDGLFVLHKCDNKKCVNPSHLFLGSQKDNVRDCINKGRNFFLKRRFCKNGHELSPDNIVKERGNNSYFRRCKVCKGLSYKKHMNTNPHKAKRAYFSPEKLNHVREWAKNRYKRNRDKILKGISEKYFKEKTKCIAGHDFSEANTIYDSRGSRRCATCAFNRRQRTILNKKEYQKIYNLKKRQDRVFTRSSIK